MEKSKKKPLKLFDYVIIFYIISVFIFFIFGRNSSDASYREQKRCYSNLKIIMSAVEMYNSDNPTNLMNSLDTNILINSKYLKGPIETPVPCCSYYSSGTLSLDGRIVCCVHGGLNIDKPYSGEYHCNKCKTREYLQRFEGKLISSLFWPIVLLSSDHKKY